MILALIYYCDVIYCVVIFVGMMCEGGRGLSVYMAKWEGLQGKRPMDFYLLNQLVPIL